MHKLLDFVCDELKDLEKKADNGGLNLTEVQYADTLAHLKKNLMKAEEMEAEEYSSRGPMYGGYDGAMTYGGSYRNSYARGRRNARRDSMGRYSGENYSREAEDMVSQLRDMMDTAPDEQTRMEIRRMVDRLSKN